MAHVTSAIAGLLRRHRSHAAAALGAAVATAFALSVGLTGTLDRRLSDAWFGAAGAAPGGSVVIVDIERAAQASGDGIRLPRAELAALIDRLADGGAERILVDLTLSGTTTPDDDAALERSLERLGAERVAITRSAVATPDPSGAVRWQRTEPLPRFGAAAAVASDLAYDPDGLLRRDGLDGVAPVLPRAAAWLAGRRGASGAREAIDYGIDAHAIPAIDASDVLDDRLAPDAVRGRRVIVASFATGIGFVIPVPRFGTLRRPDVTALSAETELSGRRIHAANGIVVALSLVAFVALATLWFARLGPVAAALAALGLSLCWLGLASGVQRTHGLIVPAGGPTIGVLIAYGAALIARLPALQRVRDAFAGIVNRTDFRLARVLDETGEALVTFAPDGQILSMNSAARRIFESGAADGGSSVHDLFGSQSDALFAATHVSRPGRLEATIERSAGGPRHLDLTVNAMPADRGEWIGIASIRDVTDQRVQVETLRRLATEDPLTKLANRSAFDAALAHVCADVAMGSDGVPRRAALLIGDLDGFKEVNDTLGHQAGDALLCEVAARLRAAVPTGALVARLGGDEFAILLTGELAGEASARIIARTIGARIGEPIFVDGQPTRVGISMGVAMAAPGIEPAALARAADLAMYEAKRSRAGAGARAA